MFTYVQRTGNLYAANGELIGTGYSGHGAALNDPGMQNVVATGPAPVGTYTIGPARVPIDHLGPLAMPLEPYPENEMFGRSGIFMHGDNASGNHSASDGCLIFNHMVRQIVDNSPDDVLKIVAEETEVHG